MKVTKLMGLAVIIVALAAVMNALAFKTATIHNDLTLAVKSTDQATVALAAADAASSKGVNTAVDASGVLTVSFSDVLQPNSSYSYDNVFKIANNAGYGVNLTWDLYAGATKVNASDVSISGLPATLSAGATWTPVNISINTGRPGTFSQISITELRLTATAQ